MFRPPLGGRRVFAGSSAPAPQDQAPGPRLVNAASILMCPHGGIVFVIATGSGPLQDGVPPAKMTDAFLVQGCTFAAGGVPARCFLVQWVVGNSEVLIDGVPSLDATSIGLCLTEGRVPMGPVIFVRI
jgi:hypothetical protein